MWLAVSQAIEHPIQEGPLAIVTMTGNCLCNGGKRTRHADLTIPNRRFVFKQPGIPENIGGVYVGLQKKARFFTPRVVPRLEPYGNHNSPWTLASKKLI